MAMKAKLIKFPDELLERVEQYAEQRTMPGERVNLSRAVRELIHIALIKLEQTGVVEPEKKS